MKVCLSETQFERILRESKEKKAAAFDRIFKQIPAGAIAACLYRPKTFLQEKNFWFLVTQGIPDYDKSAWRVSLVDDDGPWTHWTHDDAGTSLETIEDAIRAVLSTFPSVVLTEYITSDRRRITLDPEHSCP